MDMPSFHCSNAVVRPREFVFLVATSLAALSAQESTLHLAMERIEAETGKLAPGLRVERESEQVGFVDHLGAGQWIGFSRVFFDEIGARSFEARIRPQGPGGQMAVRIGSFTGPAIGRIDLKSDSDAWQTVRGSIWRVSGLQPVYLTVEGEARTAVDWIRFSPEALNQSAVEAVNPSPPNAASSVAIVAGESQSNAPTAADPHRLEAEDAEFSKDLKIKALPDGTQYLDAIRSRSWIKFPEVHYGESGRIRIRLAHSDDGDALEVRLGSRHAEPLAKAFLLITRKEEWVTLELPWEGLTPGTYDTYIVFRNTREQIFLGAADTLRGSASPGTVNRQIAQLDWIAVEHDSIKTDTRTEER